VGATSTWRRPTWNGQRGNLERVFNERDPSTRLQAIGELYLEDAVLHDPQDSVQGHPAIAELVTRLLASLPADYTFTPTGPGVGRHGVGRINWSSQPAPRLTGSDVITLEQGRIETLHVFIDP
jgi:SnoaL-like domain